MASRAVFTVYRVGELARPIHLPALRNLYMLADERKPDGRPGRQNSLFCSPTLAAAYSWMPAAADRSGLYREDEMPIWMLQCSDELPWVYPVAAWRCVEQAQNALAAGQISSSERDRAIAAYWASGVPLASWCERGREALPADEAEIMVAPYQVVEAIQLDNPYAATH